MLARLLSLFSSRVLLSRVARRERNANRQRLARRLSSEPLESRQLFATLVDASTVVWQDVDGDDVSVVFSKPFLTSANVNTILKFNIGSVNGVDSQKQQLNSINLIGGLGVLADGTDIHVDASFSRIDGGNGLADVGEINADGTHLGTVIVDGDLGRITVGVSGSDSPAIAVLHVHSLGVKGTTTGAVNVDSWTNGTHPMESLYVETDVWHASFTLGHDEHRGRLKSIYIGGSLIGGDQDGSGSLQVPFIGSIDVIGSILGGNGYNSGSLHAKTIESVHIGGNIQGSAGDDSGQIIVRDRHDLDKKAFIGSVNIDGGLYGGSGSESGSVVVGGIISHVNVGKSVVGGKGANSGSIQAVSQIVNLHPLIYRTGEVGDIKIGGSLTGGVGKGSGLIDVNGPLGALEIDGQVKGGLGDYSGSVAADKIGPVSIGDGSLLTDILRGGKGEYSGSINSTGSIGKTIIFGSVKGGAGENSGSITSDGDIASIEIFGDLVGTAKGTGRIQLLGKSENITIDGSLLGGTKSFAGSIDASGEITTLKIGKDMKGGSSFFGQANLIEAGYITALRINQMTVGGSLIAGFNQNGAANFKNNGAIRVNQDIENLQVDGMISGNPKNAFVISAVGEANRARIDSAIGTITVGGTVEWTNILAGVTPGNQTLNADASIDSVIVGGDWIASNLIAGTVAGVDGKFGTNDDKAASGVGIKDTSIQKSTIGNWAVGGKVIGTVGGNDHFGIVAQNIVKAKIGGVSLVLNSGTNNDKISLGTTGDVMLREVL